MTEKVIRDAYCRIRTIDQTIPDDVLDFMKDAAIEKLNKSDLKYIPLFQYNSAVEAHGNTLNLLKIVQEDKKELASELEAAYKEIDRLKKHG